MLLLACPAQASDADARGAEAAESAWEAAPASSYANTFSMALVDSIVLEEGVTDLFVAGSHAMSAIGIETSYTSWTFPNHRPCTWTPRCSYLEYVHWT